MSDKKVRKPKVYSILVLTLIIALVMAFIWHFFEAERMKYAVLLLSVYFAAVVLLLLRAFRRQLRYNRYSYNTIIYPGFALFAASLFFTFAYITAESFRNTGSYRLEQVVFTFVHSAKNYMFLTTPLLLFFSLSLLVSNIALVRHEGKRFVNILGIILSALLIGGDIAVGILDLLSAMSGGGNLAKNMIVNVGAAFYLYFECMIIGAAIADIIAARHIPDKDQDILIVLGCGLRGDGSPTPLLKQRLDLALQFNREQELSTGRQALFLVSGGQGSDEIQSEAESMRAYLVSQGIEKDRILIEDRSCDTKENMRFSKTIIDEIYPEANVAFFTSNYHVFRAGLKARQSKLRADGMGAATKWYFWPNASVREFVGLLTEHRCKQACLLLGLTVVYSVLTIIVYG